jgi:hypothetical protein
MVKLKIIRIDAPVGQFKNPVKEPTSSRRRLRRAQAQKKLTHDAVGRRGSQGGASLL